MDKSLTIIDRVKTRLVYSFFISDKIKSFDDHISYYIHFICLDICLNNFNVFDECIFIIQATDKNNPLVFELKCKLIELTLNIKNVNIIFEANDPYEREGGIFEKYVINKFDEYDGLTLFFHNKGLNPVYGSTIQDWCSYWIIGEYFWLMACTTGKEYFGNFLNKDKLIFGWPYMCDNWHNQWLIGGNCFWMKCKEIKKYIDDNNLKTKYITSKCISEFYFPEIFDKELIDYPYSDVLKNELIVDYYEPGKNDLFKIYLENTLPFNKYLMFREFYDYVINEYNNHINNLNNI